jgi:hypothetical protein
VVAAVAAGAPSQWTTDCRPAVGLPAGNLSEAVCQSEASDHSECDAARGKGGPTEAQHPLEAAGLINEFLAM